MDVGINLPDTVGVMISLVLMTVTCMTVRAVEGIIK